MSARSWYGLSWKNLWWGMSEGHHAERLTRIRDGKSMTLQSPSTPPDVQGAIFDVDGVLVASPHERAWREALDELMNTDWADIAPATRYAPGRFTSALYQELIAGRPRLAGARAALDYFQVPEPEQRALQYADRKQNRLLELIDAGEFHAFPDAVRFALALKARGMRLAAASSSKNASDLLRRVHLAPYLSADGATRHPAHGGDTLLDLFDVDVSGRDLPQGKPHPAIFLLAADELGIPPAASLVIEDAPVGIQAAKAGGMLALGVARANDEPLLTAAGADLVVSTLDDVNVDVLQRGHLAAV